MTVLAVSLLLGFLTVLLGVPYARKYLAASGIVSVDQQKRDRPKLPSSGGVAVLFGFLVSITSYLALSAFLDGTAVNVAAVLAALNSVFIIALIGLLDDIHIDIKAVIREVVELDEGEVELELGRGLEVETLPHQAVLDRFTGDFNGGGDSEEMVRQGIGQVPKMLFVVPAALPLIAVGAGSEVMHFPVIGAVNWGILYPLVLLPLGLLFVSNVVNMLAGTNGLAAGMSLVASTALGIYAHINGSLEASLIAFSLSATLLAFLYYNFYPASILPGDSMTYLAGAALFASIVIGNMEKFAVFIFIPWFAEFFLKARSGFTAHSWGELREDGSLEPRHSRNYSLTHPLMRRGFTERQVTVALVATEAIICVAGLLLFTGVLA